METAQVFEKSEVKVWECRNCGHIVVGTAAPEVCRPACTARASLRFIARTIEIADLTDCREQANTACSGFFCEAEYTEIKRYGYMRCARQTGIGNSTFFQKPLEKEKKTGDDPLRLKFIKQVSNIEMFEKRTITNGENGVI